MGLEHDLAEYRHAGFDFWVALQLDILLHTNRIKKVHQTLIAIYFANSHAHIHEFIGIIQHHVACVSAVQIQIVIEIRRGIRHAGIHPVFGELVLGGWHATQSEYGVRHVN